MEDVLARVKYPHLDHVDRLYPGPQVLLGNEIFWTLKEDGSNVGIALIDGVPEIRSRNCDRAQKDMYTALMMSSQWSGIMDLLTSAAQWGSEYVLFGELCQKGKSPTRCKTHEETHFVAFDLWSEKEQCYVGYTRLHQECHHAGVPVVELLGTCKVMTLEDLYSFRDRILDICKEKGEEGSVGKTFVDGKNLYFKSKLDTPKLDKIPRDIRDGNVQLPPLPESEIMGAIEKARVDLGEAGFKDIKQAMPLIARYVAEEGKHHLCSTPRNLFSYYEIRLQDLNLGN
jgi:hypothetical protein